MRYEELLWATGFAVATTLVGCNKQEAPADPSEPAVPTSTNTPGTATSTAPSTDPSANKPSTETSQKAAAEKTEAARDNAALINKASATLQKMLADAKLKKLVGKASGVLIVPEYGRAAVGVGARGGEGVLLAHRDGKWSDPAFYDIGGISVGPQFGAQGGEIAMVLMGEEPLNAFKADGTFSLNAGANLTALNYSAASQASLTKGGKNGNTIIYWSDTSGAFAGATLSATNLSWDEGENKAYYGKEVKPQDILSGKVSDEKEGPLQKALSSL